ncbi:hypothetical protein [Paenibacillus macerans]|uniref:hypothetical protein n=1 Tax=Paenibacillus macerans TaxID=44252 RepID=UPI003D31D554
MHIKSINLSELDEQPAEIQEAIAFYAVRTILPLHYSAAERERHYKVLEQAGYLERMTV